MSDPFVAEIRIFTWPWAPKGWALCDGSSYTIQQNQVLFALLGNRYGGNGTTNFQLPDLRGRVPVHYGTNTSVTPSLSYQPQVSSAGGLEAVTLTPAMIPQHTHQVYGANNTANQNPPQKQGYNPGYYGNINASTVPLYANGTTTGTAVPLAGATLGTAGGSAPHNNMQPSLVVNFCIATLGLFPPRN